MMNTFDVNIELVTINVYVTNASTEMCNFILSIRMKRVSGNGVGAAAPPVNDAAPANKFGPPFKLFDADAVNRLPDVC